MLKNIFLSLLLFLTFLSADYFDDAHLREFSLRYGGANENIVGDFTFAGASVMCVNDGEGGCDWDYDGYLYDADTKYVNDETSIPLNSASASLNLPADVDRNNIRWAGLYWQGHIEGDNPSDYSSAVSGFNSVVFRTPDGVNHTLTAPLENNVTNYYAFRSENADPKGFRFFYQCFYDVTDLVKNTYSPSDKIFTVGNIKATSGSDKFYRDPLTNWEQIKYGHWGGWSLIVVYERNAVDQAYKNVSIYDGFKVLIPMPIDTHKSIEIPVSGFLTPLSGTVDSRLLFFAMGGEKKIERDKMEIYKQHAGAYVQVSNALNSENNVLNGSVSYMGSYLDPNRKYVPGLDLDLFDASSWMENDQNETKLKLSAIFEDHNGDQTLTGVIAFSTKIHSPLIDNFLKGSDKGMGSVLRMGDNINYMLDFNNSGNEIATDVTIFDNFGDDNLTAFIENNATDILKSIRLSADNDDTHFYCYEGSSAEGCDYAFDDEQTCSVDTDDNGSVSGVHCSFNTLEVAHRRTMRFRVRIRHNFMSQNDHNVTNQAHSRYKNARTNEWIDAIGKSNVYVAGVIKGVNPSEINIDTIDDYSGGYQKEKGLKTKIAAKAYHLDTVNIDTSFNPVSYYQSSSPDISDMTVIFRLVDEDDTSYSYLLKDSSNHVTKSIFHKGDIHALSSEALMPNRAIKKAKIKAKYIDFYKLYTQNAQACLLVSSNSANIEAMPQCVNSATVYRDAFGTVAYDRCIINNGSPCSSLNHGVGNAPYDHTLGCYECSADALGSFSLSTDNFALRPFKYEFYAPTKTIAAKPFDLSVKAKGQTLHVVQNYDEHINTSYQINYQERKSACLTGSLDLSGANFSNGDLNKSTSYSEVGVLDINISEISGSEFASVDSDDTPLSQRVIPLASTTVNFIPKDFGVSWTLSNANTLNSYTYYSDNPYSMGSKLKTRVTAKNFAGAVVGNYSASCYAKDVNLTITISATGAQTNPFTLKWQDLNNPLHKDDTALVFSLPVTNQVFRVDTGAFRFSNGEANETTMINFKREVTTALEPMKVTVSKVEANDEDIYGSSSHSSIVKYYFARAHCIDYPNIIGNTLDNAPIYYEIYCKNCDKTTFPLANGSLSKDSIYWYINPNHTAFDGSVTSGSSLSGTTVSDLQLNSLDLTAPSLPHTDKIILTPSGWLVYNQVNPSATSVDFSVTFLNDSTNWAGEGKLGHIVDQNISIRKNRKISW